MRPVENKDGTGWHLESVREEAEKMILASKVRGLRDNHSPDSWPLEKYPGLIVYKCRVCKAGWSNKDKPAHESDCLWIALDDLLRDLDAPCEPCATCKGKGHTTWVPDNDSGLTVVPCPSCREGGAKCETCGGSGRVAEPVPHGLLKEDCPTCGSEGGA